MCEKQCADWHSLIELQLLSFVALKDRIDKLSRVRCEIGSPLATNLQIHSHQTDQSLAQSHWCCILHLLYVKHEATSAAPAA